MPKLSRSPIRRAAPRKAPSLRKRAGASAGAARTVSQHAEPVAGALEAGPALFQANRERLSRLLLPNSLAVVNNNDVLPTNADGTLRLVPGADLYYLSGIRQEETLLLLYPDADDPKHRELLFLREPTESLQLWEGRKLTREDARTLSGIGQIHWLHEFPSLFHRLMCECDHVYLNSNEHKRADIVVETREARFVRWVVSRYPLHDYQRLARALHRLRAEKSPAEIALMRRACDLTGAAFRRVMNFVKPGVNEREVEAEFAHEFIRNGAAFAYTPIIASGAAACSLHYIANDRPCRKDDLLLLDVGAAVSGYNADLTRTLPVSGRFTPRQRKVYDAVLRVLRASIRALAPGIRIKDWQKEAEHLMEEELVRLGLLTPRQIRSAPPGQPAVKRYFMHGLGHPLGLDVHDVGLVTEPIQAGWVMTVEPGIYIPREGFAVRLENNVRVTAQGPVDLTAGIPIEPEEIEDCMTP